MRTTRIMCCKGRQGVSTVLGTLIFIGILFTSVIPMYLVMNQADTIYEQRKLEMERFDDERSREEMDVYVFPTEGESSDNLTVKVYNRCELAVKIVRIWINDDFVSTDDVVQSMTELELGSYNVTPQEGSEYDIIVTTERGNIFESGSGPLAYQDGHWIVENRMINVLISAPGVVFKIYVTINGTDIDGSPAQVWKIGGSAFKSFTVESNGDYNVKVKRGANIIHDENVTMNWPEGPPVIWVYS
jgi:archaellum component FlaF (FlaF/FlaG flagellin family)